MLLKKLKHNQKLVLISHGFTLVEVLVAISIFAVAMGAVTGFIIMSYRAQNYTIEQAVAIEQARKGIETMIQEVREAKTGDDGSYILEKADDYEIIFYSDIDTDGNTERVRYFVYQSDSLINSDDCVVYSSGGSCDIDFTEFTVNSVGSAEAEVCVEGDFNGGNEYAEVYADGDYLGRVCEAGCQQCNNNWEGCTPFDVFSQAGDGSVVFNIDASPAVGSWGGGFCDWQEENHAMKAKVELSWTEITSGANLILYKGVTNPSGYPISYPSDEEKITVLSKYVLNQLPVFKYYDGDGNELTAPARLEQTKMIRTELIINVDPERAPQNYYLESNVQLRNLKDNL